MLGTTGAPKESHIGIRASPPKKVTGLVAQLKCLYASAGHMDSSGGAGGRCAVEELWQSCCHRGMLA